MTARLLTAAQHVERLDRFEKHSGYGKSLGQHFVGINSPRNELQRISRWYEAVFTALPEHRPRAMQFRMLVLTAREERLRSIQAATQKAAESQVVLKRALLQVAELAGAVANKSSPFAQGSFENSSVVFGNCRRILLLFSERPMRRNFKKRLSCAIFHPC